MIFYRRLKRFVFKTKLHHLPILIFLIGMGSLYSQNCQNSLSGRITDLHDDSPIVGATITTSIAGVFTQSDNEGYYSLNNLCENKIQIRVSHPSCNGIEKNVKLKNNEIINFKLEHHINELNEIIVSDQRIKTLSESSPETLLSSATINVYSSQSLGDALASISGVSILKTGSGIVKPMVHGMFGSRLGIVNNSFRLQDQEWGVDHAPNIDMNAFENIQLIKGASALKYGGDTAGGMIVLNPSKPLPKDSLYGKTILNATTNGRGKVVISDLTKSYNSGYYFNVQGTLKHFGDRSAPDYLLTNTGQRENNISLKFGRNKITKGWEAGYSFYNNTIGILRASHIGNIEDLERGISSDVPLYIAPYSNSIASPKQESSHHNAYLNWFLRFGASSKWNINYNFQFNNRNEFDIRRGQRSNIPAIDLELTTHNIASDLEWKHKENNTFNVGLVGQFQENFSNPETGVRRLIPDYLRYQLGAFYTWAYTPNNFFSLDLGVRFDYIHLDAKKYYKVSKWEALNYEEDFGDTIIRQVGNQLLVNPIFNYFNTAFNSGVSFAVAAPFNVTLNYIFSQRAPNPSELFSDGLHHSLATIEYGDLRLDREKTHKGLLTFDYKNKDLNVVMTSYYARIKNYILGEPSELELTARGAFPVWKYRAVDALFWGIDLDFSYNFSKAITFKNSTAFVYAKEVNTATPLFSIPPLNTTQYLTFKNPSGLWQFELQASTVFEQQRFPDLNFDTPIFIDGDYVYKTVDISTPPKGYTLLDLNLTLFLKKYLKKQDITLRISSSNILNVTYRDYLNRMRYYSDEMGRDFQIQLVYKY